jgi:DNA-binding NtrC family response regulator
MAGPAGRDDTSTVSIDDDARFTRQRGGALVVVEGPDAGRSVDVAERSVLLGSGTDCDLVLSDETVSRRHLVAELEPAWLLLRDQGSTNGSFVGEARFDEVRLRYGGEVRIGCTRLRWVAHEQRLDPEPSADESFGTLIGRSVEMRRVFRMLEDVGRYDTTVLIEGETGTGKELAAEELHRHSPRAAGAFVVFDCGAIPPELVASALLGHVRGAFTGAVADRRGAMLEAHGGTVFLDEIGELPLEVQPVLLRAIEKRAVCRVGATSHERADTRVVAATHRDLRKEVAAGRFREDLYYRLAVMRLRLPPLRERGADIELLARHFARALSQGREALWRPGDLELLCRQRWPGNVRELRNVVERALVLSQGGPLAVGAALTDHAPGIVPEDLPFKDAKRRFIQGYLEQLLARHGGNVSAAAREASIDRKYLRELLVRYGARSP